ncbi:toll/interleukin-1 receptor domain-containing protein [Streptomyces sp. Act143]|uniref:toll/interleukin-1 receptor domain-containing protein n=1 Tax=Streptomyces sp. Act143 TaxID=2200760 RepID=UPI0015E7FC43|nr:toll/interleukin-1 receptor domain-containing protein [Streptomyces sp. Act143]
MAVPPASGVRVFISYSHDSDSHRAAVLRLATRLRQEGVDAWIDQYEEHRPPESWPDWMRRELNRADFVLLVITAEYARRFNRESPPGAGSGVRWEGTLITADMYYGRRTRARFLPVVGRPEDQGLVPAPLNLTTSYVMGRDGDADLTGLLRVLRARPAAVPAPLGSAPDAARAVAPPPETGVRRPAEYQKEFEARHGPEGPVAAARAWLECVRGGYRREIWSGLDPDLRLSLAQDWILANKDHPDIARRPRDELANALASRSPEHPLADPLVSSRAELLYQHFAAWDPCTWDVSGTSRPVGRDYQVVLPTPVDGPPSKEMPLLMRRVDRIWRVANFRPAYVIPGWPPRHEDIPASLL